MLLVEPVMKGGWGSGVKPTLNALSQTSLLPAMQSGGISERGRPCSLLDAAEMTAPTCDGGGGFAFDFCAKLNILCALDQVGRGSKSALAVNVQPSQGPPTVKVGAGIIVHSWIAQIRFLMKRWMSPRIGMFVFVDEHKHIG